jgi:nucleoid-associated protein YgaU
MKNLKIYSIIALFITGTMFVSCAGETTDVEETNADTTETAITDEDAAFDAAMEEIDSEGLDDSTVELDGLKDFNEAIKAQDFDKALEMYGNLINEYSEKLNTANVDDAEVAQEINEISTTLSQVSMTILENKAGLSDEQKTLYNELELKFQQVDKK